MIHPTYKSPWYRGPQLIPPITAQKAARLLALALTVSNPELFLLVELRSVHKGKETFNSKQLAKRKAITERLEAAGTTVSAVLTSLGKAQILQKRKGSVYARTSAARELEHGFRDAWGEMQTAVSGDEALTPDAMLQVRAWLEQRAQEPAP